jgi:hypothetical protein
MKNKILKCLGYTAIAAVGLLGVESAQAQGVLTVTNGLLPQMGGIADLLSSLSYLAGIGFGIKAAMKLKEHNESKGQVSISAPITMAVVAALLIALPSLLSISAEAIFGTGSSKTGLTGGGAIRSIR